MQTLKFELSIKESIQLEKISSVLGEIPTIDSWHIKPLPHSYLLSMRVIRMKDTEVIRLLVRNGINAERLHDD